MFVLGCAQGCALGFELLHGFGQRVKLPDYWLGHEKEQAPNVARIYA